jgi:hypothetical protein
MNTDEYFKEIEKYIEIHFKEKLVELEKYRQLIWNTSKLAGYIGLILTVFIFLLTAFRPDSENSYFLFLLAGCFGMVYYGQKPYRKRYKREIIQTLFQAIFPGMSFYPNRFLEKETIISSGILDIEFNENTKINGEDLIITNIEGMPFEMSEVIIQENKLGVDLNFPKPAVFRGLLGGLPTLTFLQTEGFCILMKKPDLENIRN